MKKVLASACIGATAAIVSALACMLIIVSSAPANSQEQIKTIVRPSTPFKFQEFAAKPRFKMDVDPSTMVIYRRGSEKAVAAVMQLRSDIETPTAKGIPSITHVFTVIAVCSESKIFLIASKSFSPTGEVVSATVGRSMLEVTPEENGTNLSFAYLCSPSIKAPDLKNAKPLPEEYKAFWTTMQERI